MQSNVPALFKYKEKKSQPHRDEDNEVRWLRVATWKDIENRCGYNTSTFSKESSHETAFLEGQRAVVLFIKSMLTRPPMKKEKK